MQRTHSLPIILGIVGLLFALAGTCWSQTPGQDEIVLREDFEGNLPDFHTHHAKYSADETRAHSGKRSLRVTPTAESGGAYFHLDGVVDLQSDYEFSTWVYAGAAESVRFYISASDGSRRHTKTSAAGGRAGQWVQLVGQLRGEDWEATDTNVMLAMTCGAESWFDDVTLRKTKLPDPPIRAYPQVAKALRDEADRSAVKVTAAAEITLQAKDGALAAGLAPISITRPEEAHAVVPPDGLLTFALDVPAPLYVTGMLRLTPGDDLRPGLRAYVLSDDTVVAAPMVRAEAWESVGNPQTGPAPEIAGAVPPEEVELATWLLPAGRHYLTVAGPHFRSAGTFQELRLRVLPRTVEKPLYEFALLSDTHLASGRHVWMNTKLDGPSQEELGETLAALKDEGIDFAMIAGDMTNTATRPQFEAVGRVCRESGLPVFGCIGNHDSYLASSRGDALDLCRELFPDGSTNYAIDKPPLRFLVLDGAHWKSKDGRFVDHYNSSDSGGIGYRPEELEWLKQELARDKQTPTVVVAHFPMVCRGGLSSCGYKLLDVSVGPKALQLIEQAPNVVAMLAGHTHWNEHNPKAGIAHIVNPGFCEWPNAFRVFRVYKDRMEWELRQVSNRGFVRESFVVPKALSWMISTSEGDLTGTVLF